MAPPRKTRRLPQSPAAPAPRRWRRRLLIAAPILLVLYALAGFFGVPWALQRWAVPAANDQLNGCLSVNTFRCNPFALSLTLEGVEVQDAAGQRVLGLERFYGNLQASSLVRRGWVFRAVELQRPFVQAELFQDGQFNLAGLAKAAGPEDDQAAEPEPEAAPPADAGAPPWPRIRVGNVSIDQAHLVFIDRMIPAEAFRFEIDPLSFQIPELDTLADHENPHRLKAVADGGAEFGWEGSVFMNPLTSDGRLTLRGVDLSLFQPYVGRFSALHLNQGTLELDLSYGLAPADPTPRMGLELRSFALNGLRIEQDGTAVVEGLDVTVDGLSVDAVSRTARLEQIATRNAILRVIRGADGSLALAHAVPADAFGPAAPANETTPEPAPPPSAPAAAADAAAPAPWTPIVEGIDRVVNDLLNAWDVEVIAVVVEGYALRLADASTPTPADVRVHDIALTAGPVRSSAGYTVPFTFSLAQETPDGGSFDPGPGTVEASGNVGLQDLTAEIETAITGLDLTPASPYLTQAMPDASLPTGRIALRGKATVDAGAEPGSDTPGGLRSATFDGAFDLEALRIDGPLDEAPLLGYERLAIQGIAFDHRAGTLDIATIEGAGLNGAIAFDLGGDAAEEGEATDDPTPAPETETEAEAETETAPDTETQAAPDGYQPLTVQLPYRVRIGELKQTNMDALVRIQGIDPPLDFVSSNGKLTVKDLDLGPDATTPAAVSFETGLLDTGRFTLDGTIDPDLADLNNSQANLNYQLTRLPLSPFSGFTARFVGRKLTSGDLSLSNAVSVGDFKFDTVVPLTIENFELGEKVNSPDAVKLPLDLVVAILKDGNGNIKPPDVPLAGPLNDPQVSVGKLVWYAVGSLIKSVVAAPFNLIGGALAGGGDGGDSGGGGPPAAHFAPGQAQLSPDAAAQITTLADALADRPALGLRLVTVPAPAGADEQALRREALRQQIAIQDGGAPPDEARYTQAVAAWYAQAHPQAAAAAPQDAVAPPKRRQVSSGRGGSPRRAGPTPHGGASEARANAASRPPTAAEKEAWALSQMNLDPAAVTALTSQRSEAVRAALIAAGLDAARLTAAPDTSDSTTPGADATPGPAVRFEAAVP